MRSAHLQTLQDLFSGMAAPNATEVSAGVALQRCVERANAQGLVVLDLGLQAAGEARELASVLAAIAGQGVREGRAAAPTVILSGGSVLLGGRPVGAASFLLTLALALDAHPAIYALATGSVSNAAAQIDPVRRTWGGVLAPDSLLRARALGLHAGRMLMTGQAEGFFEAIGDQVIIDLWADATATVLRAVLLV
jgi:hydroxypyruvate reductase